MVFCFSSRSLALLPRLLCWFVLIPQPLNHGAHQDSLFYPHFLCDLMLTVSSDDSQIYISRPVVLSWGGSFNHVWQWVETFLVVANWWGWGGGRWGQCYWHLVGGSQGCCSTSYGAQDDPHRRTIQLKVSAESRLRNPRG